MLVRFSVDFLTAWNADTTARKRQSATNSFTTTNRAATKTVIVVVVWVGFLASRLLFGTAINVYMHGLTIASEFLFFASYRCLEESAMARAFVSVWVPVCVCVYVGEREKEKETCKGLVHWRRRHWTKCNNESSRLHASLGSRNAFLRWPQCPIRDSNPILAFACPMLPCRCRLRRTHLTAVPPASGFTAPVKIIL